MAERVILISDLILFIFGKYLDNIIACVMLFAVALEQKFALNHLFPMEVAKKRAKSCTLSPSFKICHMFNGDTNVEQKMEKSNFCSLPYTYPICTITIPVIEGFSPARRVDVILGGIVTS